MAKLFESLRVWHDTVPRSGPVNMAVDDWLLASCERPVLRLYRWEGDWLSFGYFGTMTDAQAVGKGAGLVRRATGGGIVDHRIDRTYTLVVPRWHRLAVRRGAESYRAIHEALVAAMREGGSEVSLVAQAAAEESAECFKKPVRWDVVDGAGRKVAGAGQRRSRRGLLHQGSVVAPGGADLFPRFADQLAERVETESREPSGEDLAAGVEKFASREWLARR